jgi:hypothetical protein
MSSEQSIWYRLGFALERARPSPADARRKLGGLAKRNRPPAKRRERGSAHPAEWPSADEVIASGAVALIAKTLDVWRPRKKTGIVRILKSGAAGAGAALLVELVRPLLMGRAELPGLSEETIDRVLAGAGQGLVYGVVLEPRIPGPPLLKGTLYGSAEYAVDPVGGIGKLLGPHAPLKRVPVLAHLLEGVDPHDRVYLEHVTFGIALALIYGSSASSNGIAVEDDE